MEISAMAGSALLTTNSMTDGTLISAEKAKIEYVTLVFCGVKSNNITTVMTAPPSANYTTLPDSHP